MNDTEKNVYIDQNTKKIYQILRNKEVAASTRILKLSSMYVGSSWVI